MLDLFKHHDAQALQHVHPGICHVVGIQESAECAQREGQRD